MRSSCIRSNQYRFRKQKSACTFIEMPTRAQLSSTRSGSSYSLMCINSLCSKYVFVAAIFCTVVLGTAHLATSYRRHTSQTPLHRLLKSTHRPDNSMDTLLQRPKIVLFGDSLTERSFDTGGWGAVVQSKYSRRVSTREPIVITTDFTT